MALTLRRWRDASTAARTYSGQPLIPLVRVLTFHLTPGPVRSCNGVVLRVARPTGRMGA